VALVGEIDQPERDGPVALLIDDDDAVRAFVCTRLVADGFRVVEATSGEAGLELLTPEITVVLVDVGLPGIDGFTVVRKIRRSSRVPIVMMTAASDEGDRVLGLELGADDYIVKPFLPREMIARVRAAIRRAAPPDAAPPVPRDADTEDGLVIDVAAREARIDRSALTLTAREFELLAFLASHPRQVFTREQLLRQVWETEPGWVGDSTVTEHIHRVRKELDRHPASRASIVTIRGIGYRYESSPESG
jgi:DNA-binding response OmpR family regulator